MCDLTSVKDHVKSSTLYGLKKGNKFGKGGRKAGELFLVNDKLQ